MSWFKRGKMEPGDQNSDNGSTSSGGRSRTDTDPELCLQVFQNHWTQALGVIKVKGEGNGQGQSSITSDDIEAVIQNFEQMINLLAAEDGLDENGHGMPGPILHYLLEHDIFENFCSWCQRQPEYGEKLKLEQLRMFEILIGQSHQLLLIHKAVIQPLLRLLASCAENTNSSKIERRLILILHQICASIAQETVILESFFNTSANHGPAKFLIFSLLITFIHREGSVGQQARDALLLIMTLSSKYPRIGEFIAKQSDFCVVLATGLSGLYSTLPRKIPVSTDDWFQITDYDIEQIPGIQMILNSLEFCNAVIQISHNVISDQLIEFIYKGFLVPVMGPALHQDVSGLPLPLLDSAMFANSREEVIAATAYLELFLRKITEPALIKAFLKFILTEQNDEIIILDSLITRINSSNKLLCVISLSLFKTLIDLNCEDVMFQLVLRYLIPCTHVMVSQRRSVKDLDLYGKSAEKFLSLRPNCCIPDPNDSPLVTNTPLPIPSSQTERSSTSAVETPKAPATAFPPGTFGSKLEHYETNYNDYLLEARLLLQTTYKACTCWTYPYDGEKPPANVFKEVDDSSLTLSVDRQSSLLSERLQSVDDSRKSSEDSSTKGSSTNVQILSHGGSTVDSSDPNDFIQPRERDFKSYLSLTTDDVFRREDSLTSPDVSLQSELSDILRRFSSDNCDVFESEDVNGFISYLSEVSTPPDQDVSMEECMKSLDSVITNLCSSVSSSRTSTPISDKTCSVMEAGDTAAKSEVPTNTLTSFDVIDLSSTECNNKVDSNQNDTSFVEITLSAFSSGANVHDTLPKLKRTNSLTSGESSKSVSFSLPSPSMQSPATLSSGILPVPCGESQTKSMEAQPYIGPFLSSLILKLEGMMQNNLAVNLVLTGVISRLAAYPQPLLRSFLLNHNLVFQPTVKSLVQVLSSVRQKVDSYSYTVQNFEGLLLRARRSLVAREENYKLGVDSQMFPSQKTPVINAKQSPINTTIQVKERRKLSLTDLLFKRTPRASAKQSIKKGAPQLEMIPGRGGVRYVNRRHLPVPPQENPMESSKTRNAVYCALILEEFVKELAAVSQEHSVLLRDEGYYSN